MKVKSEREVLLHIKGIPNKDLLYNIGNYTQYFLITYKKKESEIYIYIYLSEHVRIYKNLKYKYINIYT